MCGIELANAFIELTDPTEQRARFEADRVRRHALYGPDWAMDEDFLAALTHGMPPAGEIAMGFDRLAMIAAGATGSGRCCGCRQRIERRSPFPLRAARRVRVSFGQHLLGSRSERDHTRRKEDTRRATEIVMLLNGALTERVIGLAIEVHRRLGPGLLKSAYKACLCFELQKAEITFERQVGIPIIYQEVRLHAGFRADIVIAQTLIVELKW